ncbi:MAG: apolipoprotein N-acyltransferase [Armatimonadota bacterium]|nr:apolipoprotein N-acyltransferase [Armatimonadota bacterium]
MSALPISRRAAWGLPIAGGILHALAFPPFGFMLLVFVSIVPLLIAVRGASGRQAFGRGYLFGLAFGLPNMFWLHTFVGKWTSSWFLGAVPWLLVCLAFAVYFGLFAWLARKAWLLNWPWAIPLAWAAVEVFRSKIPALYYPWSLSGASLFKVPAMLQPAHYLGEFFIGAWIACIATVVAMLFMKESFAPRKVWPYIGFAVLVMMASAGMYATLPTGPTLTLAAVQPGVDLAFTPASQQHALLSARIPEALEVAAGRERDLTVFPEGIARWPVGADAPDLPFDATGLGDLVIGGQRSDGNASYQSAFGSDGNAWSYADKTRLVIFGEYVPMRERLPFLDAFGLPDTDLRPGGAIGTLEIRDLKVAPVLCFEALFEEVSRVSAGRGADVIAVMSIDDWYQGTGAIDALIAGAVMRAIENGLPVVRSASLGPSLIVNSRGDIVAYAEMGETTTIIAEVASGGGDTGTGRVAFMVLACVAALVVAFRR